MPSFVGRPADLQVAGPRIDLKLWVPHYVAIKHARSELPIVPPIEAVGLIDTGAIATIIQEGVSALLGLTPVGTVKIATAMTRKCECKQYHVQLLFPQGHAADVLAIETPWPERSDQYAMCFIGRDILKQSILIYNGFSNMFSLIF